MRGACGDVGSYAVFLKGIRTATSEPEPRGVPANKVESANYTYTESANLRTVMIVIIIVEITHQLAVRYAVRLPLLLDKLGERLLDLT